MALWQEESGSTIQMSSGRFVARVTKTGSEVSTRFFKLAEESEKPTFVKLTPETASEIVLIEYPALSDLKEAELLARESLGALRQGKLPYETKPYMLPAKPEQVRDYPREDFMLFARILKWQDGRFEAKFQGFANDGYFVPSPTPQMSTDPDYSWCNMVHPIQHFGDDPEELGAFAVGLLDELVSEHSALLKPVAPGTLRK